jgi:EPS-associated MarR family transcriptional regulator
MGLDDGIRYRLFQLLHADPELSQRDLARTLGISLGKANYCLRALIAKGWVKTRGFRRSGKKLSYAYLLTPAGIEEKAEVTVRFLQRKLREYDALSVEIEELRQEVRNSLGKDQ